MVIPVEYPFNLKWKKAYLIMGSENRRMVCLFNSKTDRTTIAYARYLLSVKLRRELRDDETVDHIDNNKLNDDISNLQLLTAEENIKKYHQAFNETHPIQHGTERGYKSGCRCELCTAYRNNYQNQNRRDRQLRKLLGIPNKTELKEYAKNIIGRDLLPGEVIHLRDGNIANLAAGNVMVFASKTDLNRYIKSGEDISVVNWDIGDVCRVPFTAKTSNAKAKEYSSISYGIRVCEQCHNEYEAHSSDQKYCSHSCAQLASRRCRRPTRDELEQMVWEKPSSTIAKELGVTGKTIEKWCKTLNIRKPEPGYWQKKAAGKL